MLDCLIVGDTLSVALHLNVMYDECQLQGIGARNTRQFNEFFPNNFDAKTVIISLGMYDYKGIDTEAELRKMRQRVDAKYVFWVLPLANIVSWKIPKHYERTVPIEKIQSIIKAIAAEYGDTIITTPKDEVSTISKEVAFPSDYGYKAMARRIMESRAGVEVFPVTPQ